MPIVPFADTEVSVTRPLTALDVLHWRVWIPSLPLGEYVDEALDWIDRWAADEIGELFALVEDLGDEEAIVELIKLGHRICATAELPEQLAEDMAHAMDMQNEVPPDWKPKDLFCTCPRCRRDDIDENPPGIICKYDELNPVAIQCASVAMGIGEGAASEPYYLAQIRTIANRAQARMLRYSRENREERNTQRDIARNMLAGHRAH